MERTKAFDLADFLQFDNCFAGPEMTPMPSVIGCVDFCLQVFDYDGDSDVDLEDFAALARE